MPHAADRRTGLVGGWLVRQLLVAGAYVVCLVRDWAPQSELVRAGMICRVRNTVSYQISPYAINLPCGMNRPKKKSAMSARR